MGNKKKTKRVTIGISMDSSFISLLLANTTLQGLKDKDELDAVQQLAMVVQLEARGALSEQVHAATRHVWRNLIEVDPKLRSVVEVS